MSSEVTLHYQFPFCNETHSHREKGQSILRLQIVVPTVKGREAWLDACLASICDQIDVGHAELKVSGNGTEERSREIAKSYQARFVLRPDRVTAEDHAKMLVSEAVTEASYCWLIADDDLMAPGAFDTVMSHLPMERGSEQGVAALIGRARYFRGDAVAHLRELVPSDDLWSPGRCEHLGEVAVATKGQVRIGAFVFSTGLFGPLDMDRYSGTSHGMFGGFWDGLAVTPRPTVVVSEALVFLRDEEKEWDESIVVTLLGRKTFAELLPREVKEHLPAVVNRLSRNKALTLAASTRAGERKVLKRLVSSYQTFEFGSRLIARLPRQAARSFLPVFRKLTALIDSLYVLIFRH